MTQGIRLSSQKNTIPSYSLIIIIKMTEYQRVSGFLGDDPPTLCYEGQAPLILLEKLWRVNLYLRLLDTIAAPRPSSKSVAGSGIV